MMIRYLVVDTCFIAQRFLCDWWWCLTTTRSESQKTTQCLGFESALPGGFFCGHPWTSGMPHIKSHSIWLRAKQGIGPIESLAGYRKKGLWFRAEWSHSQQTNYSSTAEISRCEGHIFACKRWRGDPNCAVQWSKDLSMPPWQKMKWWWHNGV